MLRAFTPQALHFQNTTIYNQDYRWKSDVRLGQLCQDVSRQPGQPKRSLCPLQVLATCGHCPRGSPWVWPTSRCLLQPAGPCHLRPLPLRQSLGPAYQPLHLAACSHTQLWPPVTLRRHIFSLQNSVLNYISSKERQSSGFDLSTRSLGHKGTIFATFASI